MVFINWVKISLDGIPSGLIYISVGFLKTPTTQEHRYSVYWYTWRTARCHRQSSWKRFQTSACKVFFFFSNGWKRLFVYACFDSFKNQLKMKKSWESSQKLKKKKPSVQTNRSLYLYSCLLAQSLESEISSKFLKDTYKII